jgi:hypothetical protein
MHCDQLEMALELEVALYEEEVVPGMVSCW